MSSPDVNYLHRLSFRIMLLSRTVIYPRSRGLRSSIMRFGVSLDFEGPHYAPMQEEHLKGGIDHEE